MNKLYTSIVLIATALFFMSNSGGRGSVGNEAVTASPGETGRTCGVVGCHNGNQFGTSVSVQLIDAAGDISEVYKPSLDYIARITITNTTAPSGYGFQMTAVNAAGDGSGVWGETPSGVQSLTLGVKSYVEHAMTLSDPVIEIPWTAPADDEGDVSFYISANAVNGNGGTGGDGATNANFSFSYDGPSSIGDQELSRISVFPNPAMDRLSVVNNTSTDFDIFNAQGKLVLAGNMDYGQIDVSQLNAGIYFLKLEQGKQIERFIKL